MLFGSNSNSNLNNAPMNADDLTTDVNTLNTIVKLQEYIQHAISQLNYETAVFLSELLYAECSPLEKNHVHRLESVYLYSLSLYLQGEFQTALRVSKDFKEADHMGISYIFARCCLQLDTDLKEAVDALLNVLDKKPSVTSNGNLTHMPTVATINCLLGRLNFKLERTPESALFYSSALNADPYLWEAYTSLCALRATIDLKRLYSLMTKQNQSTSNRFKSRFSVSKPHSTATPYQSSNRVPSSSSSSSSSLSLNANGSKQQSQVNALAPQHTSIKGQPTNSMLNKANVVVSTSAFSSPPSSKQPTGKLANRSKLLTTPPSKLLHTSNFKTPRNNTLSRSSGPKRGETFSSMIVKSEHHGLLTTALSTTATTPHTLAELILTFARVLKASSQYDSYKAIRLLENRLPSHIKSEMPWCQAQLGKLHYEILNYEESLNHFNQLRRMQPTRTQDIEIFSTLLWHLHDSTRLSHLSNELVETLPNKPQTWCCLGNLYSLQRDHEDAIKYFEKATKIDYNFAYAYTLQGHEHSSNDSIDTAKNCYRRALACDPQHYNAYYGLGMCCMKLGQYDKALLFFEKARNINPVNVILICCCGVALEKLSYQEKALQYYEQACELQPSSSLAKFKKAHLLYSMARYSAALENFEELAKLAPDEATVHFLLGQLYQIMGRKKDAVKEFTVAMNLDPKGNPLIIDALEKCHSDE